MNNKIGYFVRHKETQLFGVILFLDDDLMYTTPIEADAPDNMTRIYRNS